MEIKKIPKTNTSGLTWKRAAAYTRVSVMNNETEKSLKNQTSYYEQLIRSNPDYIFHKVYTDNGLTGTKDTRAGFQMMMKDARNHKFDILITKSVTRLARNTVTFLSTVRELKSLGIDIYFEKENLHSISPDGELMLTLIAMYAEEEARSVSDNIHWSYEKRFIKGEGVMKRLYGYQLIDGRYEVDPFEEEVVKAIYQVFLNGSSIYGITKGLNDDGIKGPTGGAWNTEAVGFILRNEKYTGNMLLQKTYVPDFRDKKVVRNKGQWKQYYVEDTHPAIITKETFDAVQEELKRRAEIIRKTPNKVSPDNLFYGKVICAECGYFYKRYAMKNPKYKKRPWYTCYSAKDFREKCTGHIIKEDTLIAKTKERLNLSPETKLTREMIEASIDRIYITADFKLQYYLKNGRVETVDWRDYFYGTPERRQQCREQCRKQWQDGKFDKIRKHARTKEVI